MTCMTETFNNTTETLVQIFFAVTNIEINLETSPLLCSVCIEELNRSNTFIKQCQKSQEVFSHYVSDKKSFVFETESKPESVECIKNITNVTEDHEIIIGNSKKAKHINRPMRLKPIPYEEVLQAIEESERTFKQNTSCIKCDVVCSNSRALSMHVSHMHIALKDRWCVQCNKEFDDLKEHTKDHSSANLKCRFCDKSFRNKCHLKEHLLSHSGYRQYHCEQCESYFLTERHLRQHLKTHLSEDVKNCETELNNGQELSQISVGNNLTKSKSQLDYKLCTECGKQFKTVAKLYAHMRIHTGEVPFECGLCKRRFSTRAHLRAHSQTHSGEKQHTCYICGKGFSQAGGLNTHLKIHTGRPETCKICGQKFCRPAQLHIHMRRHTGEKPYPCKECGQRFFQRCHLTQHERVHTGIRPYQCKYCDKSFKQHSSLKAHVDIHFGNKPFKCTLCSYACRQSYSLRMHMEKHSSSSKTQRNKDEVIPLHTQDS